MKTHKEMKEEYKLYKSPKGVYQIKNKKNGKILIWNENGEDSFEYEILAEINEKDDEKKDYKKEVRELEELYIEEMQPFGEKGYNKK